MMTDSTLWMNAKIQRTHQSALSFPPLHVFRQPASKLTPWNAACEAFMDQAGKTAFQMACGHLLETGSEMRMQQTNDFALFCL